jgi:hypothetical protein
MATTTRKSPAASAAPEKRTGRYTAPLTDWERHVHGVGAERCPETGFVFESGIGALPKAAQAEMFKRQLADRDWVAAYMQNDPHARDRHPELFR